MKKRVLAAIVTVMVLTMTQTAFAGPHGGSRHGGGHFGGVPRHGGGFRFGGAPRPGGHPRVSAPHHIGGPRTGAGSQPFNRGPHPGGGRPAHAEAPQSGGTYIEDSYTESSCDNGYIGNNTVSAVCTVLSSLFGAAQNMQSSSYAAQDDGDVTYITPNIATEMENGNSQAQLQRQKTKN